MHELRMAEIVDRFRANIKGAGIVLSDSQMAQIVEKGYLKQVLAFESAAPDPSMDLIPAYLDAWGECEPDEPSAAEAASGGATRPMTGAPKPFVRTPVDILDTTIMAIAPLIRSGEISPVELVEASLS
ncbi:MAG: hypothetical protein Q8M76_05480, partial [Spirochaetaceae bacterium]|nr:hypothetical protein [Spirochaetaceae bacterium]